MEVVKSRKVGNSTTLTIPKELNVGIGEEFFVYKGVDGVIVFAPRMKNPFGVIGSFPMSDEWEGVEILDSEVE